MSHPAPNALFPPPEKTGFNTPFGIDLAYIVPRGLDEIPEQTVEFDPLEYEKRTSM